MNTTERAAKPNLPSAITLAAALIQVFSRRLNSPPDASNANLKRNRGYRHAEHSILAGRNLSQPSIDCDISARNEGRRRLNRRPPRSSQQVSYRRGGGAAGEPVVAEASSGSQVIALRSYLNPVALLSASFVEFITR